MLRSAHVQEADTVMVDAELCVVGSAASCGAGEREHEDVSVVRVTLCRLVMIMMATGRRGCSASDEMYVLIHDRIMSARMFQGPGPGDTGSIK